MLKRPPQHRADATPVLIINDDDAWDHERIDREFNEIKEINKTREKADRLELSDHPYSRYQSGMTRMDLDARAPWRGENPAAADYLKADAAPVRFTLRRLRWREYHRVIGMIGSGTEAALKACQLGLVSVEGEPSLEMDPDAAERSDADMQRLHDFFPGLAVQIGNAVIAASLPLRDDEKKA